MPEDYCNECAVVPFENVIRASRKLIDCVSYDVNGVHGKGGNGGLTSTETIRASDELRLAISSFEGKKK